MTLGHRLPSDQDASGRLLGARELEYLEQVIASGVLNSTRGSFAALLEKRFCELLGGMSVVACSSGTAAVHAAVAALDLEPGTEVITSPVTDFGAVAPILWQGCIPVFADVDPVTLNVTAQTVADRLSPRTGAVIVTHLFGNPADSAGLAELAANHSIPLIEDCCQAYGAAIADRPVGSFGALACFSLQQTKHITAGEGGMVAAAAERFAQRAHQFVNKARIYTDPVPEHHFLSLNYRMTELQGAVAAAQLERLCEVVERRRQSAAQLTKALAEFDGIQAAQTLPGAEHSYWRFPLRIDPQFVRGGMPEFGRGLKRYGIACSPGYQRPVYMLRAIAEQRTFGSSRYPFTLASPEAVDYSRERFPGVAEGLASVIVLPWNECFGDREVQQLSETISAVYQELAAR
jgi:perosamine synthetase